MVMQDMQEQALGNSILPVLIATGQLQATM
jgi:hypothetical protein